MATVFLFFFSSNKRRINESRFWQFLGVADAAITKWRKTRDLKRNKQYLHRNTATPLFLFTYGSFGIILQVARDQT